MSRIDLTGKGAAVCIVLILDVIFFGVAIALSLHAGTKDLADKVWGLFTGTNGGLFLILNADSKSKQAAAPDGASPNPTPAQ